MGQGCCIQRPDNSATLCPNGSSLLNGDLSNFEVDNIIINRLRPVEVIALLRLFNSKCLCNANAPKKLIYHDGLLELYPAYVNDSVLKLGIVRAYDRQNRDSIDFRDFCFAASIIIHGTRDERLLFLFKLFMELAKPDKHSKADGLNIGIMHQSNYNNLLVFCGIDAAKVKLKDSSNAFTFPLTLDQFIDAN